MTRRLLTRRAVLVGGGILAAGLGAGPLARRLFGAAASVFVASGQRYDRSLAPTMREALLACGVVPGRIRGTRVLLKPNMVEPRRDRPQMTTHPAFLVAAIEVFRDWGAEVLVGEGPGHLRDTEVALAESGIDAALEDAHAPFADLNYEDVVWVPKRGRHSRLEGFALPVSVASAHLVVSLPKMKTHHWIGVTASMKNLYGVLPGLHYGWPKNVLHYYGIPKTVADLNASMPPTLTIVDGIECMEGDGPILGTAKQMGLVVAGTNLPAVDATVARIMGFNPRRIQYLRLAAPRVGPIADWRIEQRGERWQDLVDPFAILDRPHLERLRASPDGPLVS